MAFTLSTANQAALLKQNIELEFGLRVVLSATDYMFVQYAEPPSSTPDECHTALDRISNISWSFDPVERKVQGSSMTVTLTLTQSVRYLMSTVGFANKKCTLFMFPREGAWADRDVIYLGYCEDATVTDDATTLTLQIRAPESFAFDREILGYWHNAHPLDMLSDILDEAGVSSDFRDTTTFDKTDAGNADIGHWVVDRSQYDLQTDNSIKEPQQAAELLDELLLILGGCFSMNVDGELQFVRSDPDAATADDWTEDDIGESLKVEQVYKGMINEVRIKSHHISQGRDYEAEELHDKYIREFIHKDTDSQTRFKTDGTSDEDGISAINLEFRLVNGMGKLDAAWTDASPANNETAVVYSPGGGLARCCGFHWPGFTAGSQPTNADLSSGREVYYLATGAKGTTPEVIKFDALTISTDSWADDRILDKKDESDYETFNRAPSEGTFTLDGRGSILGTSAIAHSKRTVIRDITIPVAVAQRYIDRFANGAPVITVETSFSKFKYELTDLVTLTTDRFCWFGYENGSDTTIKWEIVGKEIDFHGDTPRIRWRLMFIQQDSAPSVTAAYSQRKLYTGDVLNNAIANGYIDDQLAGKYVLEGYDYSNTLLAITIDAGVAGAPGARFATSGAYTFTAIASKDHYVGIDLEARVVFVKVLSLASSTPDVETSEILLWKIVTDATTVDAEATTDLRPFTAVSASVFDDSTIGPRNHNLDTEAGILVPNGDFGVWTYPNTQATTPPDQWLAFGTISTTTYYEDYDGTAWWLADQLYYSTTVQESGGASIYIDCTAMGGTLTELGYISKDFIVIQEASDYWFEARVRSDDAGDIVRFQINSYDEDKALLDEEDISHSIAVADTWETKVHVAKPYAGARFFKLTAWMLDGTTGEGLVHIDHMRLTKLLPSFYAYRSTAYSVATGTDLGFQATLHNYGDHWDETVNSDFTVPKTGAYQFAATVSLSLSAAKYHYLSIVVDSSETVRGARAYNATGGTADIQATVTCAALNLTEGEVVTIQLTHDDTGSRTLNTGSVESFITGSLIQ